MTNFGSSRFLCEVDKNGFSFEHQRQWIKDKLLFLASVFSIDVCAYAILSNHFHAVLHIDQDTAQHWSMDEVIERWHQLTKGAPISQLYPLNPTSLCATELVVLKECSEL